MKDTPLTNSQISTTEETNDNAETLPQTDTTTERKNNTNHSTQMQLLTLARVFALDGGLVEKQKQMPLEDRASKRARVNKLRQQQNLEAIIHKALSYCSSDQAADRADPDWFTQYTALAENISSQAMQDLWAKILGGEITHPGAFSIKTLQAFKAMSIHDAKLLAKACRLSVKDNRGKNIRIISGSYQVPGLLNFFSKQRIQSINLSHVGLSYSDILTLAENHLVYAQETESAPLTKGETINFNYNGKSIALMTIKQNSVLRFYKFTPTGIELARLIGDNPDEEYFAQLKQQLQSHFLITEN